MPEVKRTVIVAHTPDRMFNLVDAVEAYPEFLPWCGATTVRHRDETATRATLQINYRGIRQSFTTENAKRAPGEMLIRLVEGPFRSLEGAWRFTALGPGGCKVEFRLSYEFSSRLLEKLIGPVFDHIAGSLVEAFLRRADQKYRGQECVGLRPNTLLTMIRVEVAYALRMEQALIALEVPEGTTARGAVERSGITARFPEVDPARMTIGIFGRAVAADTRLLDGDRVEIYRPLTVDPKDARRARVKPRQSRSGEQRWK